MHSKERSLPLTAFLCSGDLALTELALIVANYARHRIPLGMEPDIVYVTPRVGLLVACIWLSVFYLWGAYDRQKLSNAGEETRTVVFAVTFSLFTLASFFYFLKVRDFSRLLFLYFYFLDLCLLVGFRIGARAVLRQLKAPGYGVNRTLIVGTGEESLKMARRMDHWKDYQVVGFVDNCEGTQATSLPAPILGRLADTKELVHQYAVDKVIITPTAESRGQLAELVLDLQDQALKISVVPDLLEIVAVRTGIENLRGIPLIRFRKPAIAGLDRLMKRGLDLFGALVGILVSGPLMLIMAILIKLDSPGPVFFVQQRAGQYGKPFRMYKLRSMVADAEEVLEKVLDSKSLEQPVFKIKDDPRVTRIGRWLRRTSLDELPQFFNVLKGEMSLVGPRPEEARLVKRYNSWQKQRLIVKPGMTGSMQISGRADLLLDERVRLELAYIENYSLWEDIKILLKTVFAVLSGRGAY